MLSEAYPPKSDDSPSLALVTTIARVPNLETLKVKRSGSHEFIGAEDELRDENIQFQLDCPSQGWRLSSLYGDVGSLYTMGLQARVPNVTIGGELSSHFDDFGLSELLAPLRPLQLSLSQDEAAFDTAWLSNAIAVGWESLVRLDFRVECLYPGEPVAKHEERLVSRLHSGSGILHELTQNWRIGQAFPRSLPHLSVEAGSFVYQHHVRF